VKTKNQILSFLRENKEYLQKSYQIDKIALFGSVARDEMTKDSDIDIVVDMPSSFDNFFNLKYFLEEKFGSKVDLIKEKNLRLFIKKQIQKDLIYV
jgi:predicted nucleotidyltransferase